MQSIYPGDTGYDTLKATWEAEGSPGQFTEQGEFGGYLWVVLDQGDERGPAFLLHASAGPTDPGYNKPAGWKARKGWYLQAGQSGLRLRQDERGLHIRGIQMPKE